MIIRNLKSKQNRQYNGQKKKGKKDKQNNDPKTPHKTEDCATRTPLKTRGEIMCSGSVSSSCSSTSNHNVTNLLVIKKNH